MSLPFGLHVLGARHSIDVSQLKTRENALQIQLNLLLETH